MTNETDSFIDEVTEDLRRDRLFAAFRRYGWIGGAVIALIVGGAGYSEWQKSRAEAAARAFGDGVEAALAAPDPAAALKDVDTQGTAPHQTLLALLEGGAEPDNARAAEDFARASELAPDEITRDLGLLRQVYANGAGMDPAARDAMLTELSKPGAPFELLALEQKAVALIGAGKTEAAVSLIRQIQQRPALTAALRQRLSEMLITLDAEPLPATPALGDAMANAPLAGEGTAAAPPSATGSATTESGSAASDAGPTATDPAPRTPDTNG